MNDIREELFERYTHGLKEFVAGGGEPALMAAYDLGRRALAAGLGVLEMAALHYRALVSVSAYASTPEEGTRTVKAAEQFFIESLSPFEIALRGYRESNTTL